ncbi:MAG: MFS transporter [Chloroflexi bacterium]|nr:MFS transporter [Chloroflexota bacterium]
MVAMLNFAPLLPLVREEFALTNAWAGTLATATILSHTLLQLPGGYLADRIGVKRAVELGLLVMALSVIASAFATSMVLLLACRFLLGAGTATAFISTLSCVNVLVPTEKRAVAQGLFGAAANVGVLLLLLLSERMAHWEGWRGTFLMEGILILGIVWLFAAWFRLETGASQVRPASWGETVRDRPLYLLGLAHILSYGVFTALSTWMATFLWEAHGIGLEWAGPLAALLPASAVVARVLGGALSVGRERRVILASCFVTALGVASMPLLPGPGLAVLDLLLLGWFASMPFGSIFSYISLVSPKGASGRGFSLVNFVGNVGALAFPPAIGYALDATGSFTLGFGLVAMVGLAGSAAVAAWLPRPGR